jgi:hypothetical protein
LGAPKTSVPTLPATSQDFTVPLIAGECSGLQLLETNPITDPYPVLAVQSQLTRGVSHLQPTPT